MSTKSQSMSVEQFAREIARGPRGRNIVYHTGLLARDAHDHAAADAIREAAWNAFERGRVALCCRRVSPDAFEYIAQPTAHGLAAVTAQELEAA